MGAALPGSAAALHPVGEGRGKRALVTGIGGFTGRHMARELASAGYHVFGTTHRATPDAAGRATDNDSRAPDGIDRVTLELCDRSAVDALVAQVEPDVVVHLAGLSFVEYRDPDALYRVNLLGTRNLLAALAARPAVPSAVLLASSATVYGHACSAKGARQAGGDAGTCDAALTEGLTDALTERIMPAPVTDYAVSKWAMEAMARLWSDRLPIVIVRPFNYTGVGQTDAFLIPKIVSHFRAGRRIIELGNTGVARDFSDVRVVVNCYRRLLAIAPAGECFNICSGRAYSVAEVLASMAEIAGYEIDVRTRPALARATEVGVLVGSNARLRGAIGEVNQIPLAETLCWMYHS